MTTPPFAAILPAAGRGQRFGPGDKLLVEIAGQSVLRRSVALFASRPEVSQIVLVTTPDRFAPYRAHLQPILPRPEILTLVEGGRERWESVLLGLRAVRPGIRFVAVHDAARPLTPPDLIAAAFAAAIASGGSVPLLPEPATLKRVGPDGRVAATVARAGLFQAQTPQCFALDKLRAAYEQLLAQNQLADVTDDAQVFEKAGLPVQATPGSPLNVKITTAEDVALAEALCARKI